MFLNGTARIQLLCKKTSHNVLWAKPNCVVTFVLSTMHLTTNAKFVEKMNNSNKIDSNFKQLSPPSKNRFCRSNNFWFFRSFCSIFNTLQWIAMYYIHTQTFVYGHILQNAKQHNSKGRDSDTNPCFLTQVLSSRGSCMQKPVVSEGFAAYYSDHREKVLVGDLDFFSVQCVKFRPFKLVFGLYCFCAKTDQR
jgi:hypothetical protein